MSRTDSVVVLMSSFRVKKKSELYSILEVSKPQKQFFLKLHCPKMNKILGKVLPYEDRSELCQIFCLFLGKRVLRKNAFEIY